MPKNIKLLSRGGRAGRDGGDADCIMLYSARDVNTARYFIENPDETRNIRLKCVSKLWRRLNA